MDDAPVEGSRDSYEPDAAASTGRRDGTGRLSPLGAMVRRHDPDRFLTALFAPPDRREALFALYAFNHELARAWEVASHPTLALIRLQWWREVLQGATRRHEVATPLMRQVQAGHLDAGDLLALVEGRERVADGLAEPQEWRAYLDATAGHLAQTAGRALGASGAVLSRLRALGTGFGVAGHLRPGPDWGGQVSARPEPALRPSLVAWGLSMLDAPARIDRAILSAGLIGVLARRDLRRPGQVPCRGLGDRAAVALAAARGRV